MVTLEMTMVAMIFTLGHLLLPHRLFVFAHTFANEDLHLEDSFHSLVRRGTWRHNNGNWYENDVLWTDTRAHKTISKVKCSHVSFSDHVVKNIPSTLELDKVKFGPDQFVNESSRSTQGRLWRLKKNNWIAGL